MNEQLRNNIDSLVNNIESRKQSEKLLVLGILIAGLVLVYLSLSFDPLRADIQAKRAQVASVERQINAQQTAYQQMVAQSQEDPNRFANDRLAVIERQQAELQSQIQALAGDLVTPNQMTELLTTVLERQSGLELNSFRNVAAQPLRTGLNENSGSDEGGESFDGLNDSLDEITGQVYSHGLIIEFEGDYFSTLKYLRFLEQLTGSFFWDEISFQQGEWPNASITLEIHTLSTDQGFIGV